MRRAALTLCSVVTTLLLFGTANSQEGETPQIVFIEIFGCTYNANNDMGDLMAVANRWNDWADDNGVSNYTANILTPYFYSTAFPYDVLWLGVYEDAEAMGAGESLWLREGGDLDAEFGEVVDCAVHAQFAGTATHIPENPPEASEDDVGLTAFQDCSLRDGRSALQALGAHGRWGNYLAQNGADVFMGALFPIAGEDPQADYDYKAVTGFSSAEAYGQFLGAVIPDGLQAAENILGGNTVCDTPRVYTTTVVREAAAGE